jgi:hypothetical protein
MDASRFRDQAARCRRLAAQLPPGDPARKALLKLAEEYEKKMGGDVHHDPSTKRGQ